MDRFQRYVRSRGQALVVFVSILSLALLLSFSLRASDPEPLPRVWFVDNASLNGVDTATSQVALSIALQNEARALGVDPTDRSVWALRNANLLKFSETGAALLSLNLRAISSLDHPWSLALNPYDRSVWVASENSLLHLSPDGVNLLDWQSPGNIQALVLDIDESAWVLTKTQLIHLSVPGMILGGADLSAYVINPGYLAIDNLGGIAWVAAYSDLIRLNINDLAQAPTVVTLPPPPGTTAHKIDALAVHPVFGTLWTVSRDTLYLHDRQGTLLRAVDLVPHALGQIRSIAYDPKSFSLWIGGTTAIARFTNNGDFVAKLPIQKSATAIGAAPFTLQPQLSVVDPPDNALINNPQPTIRLGLGATCSGSPCLLPDPYIRSLTLDVVLNGNPIGPLFTIEGSQAQFTPASRLPEGANTFTATATDLFGHASEKVTGRFTIDTIPPRFLAVEPADGTTFSTPDVVIEGQVDDPTASVLLLNAAGDTASLGGASFAFAVTLEDGANVFTLVARDPTGNAVERTLTLSFTLNDLPPNPATVAPPLDPSVATVLSTATEFLYTGPNPIQTGVAPGTIEPRRVAVIRGKTLTRDGAPLSGVSITVLNHPELGQTLSRADGMFDLAVNGGGVLTVNYAKDGYLPAQRQVDTPWQDYVFVEDVALVPLDPQVTTVTASAAAPQIAQGSVSTDADGSRRTTMLFMPGMTATMVLPDGTTQPLTTLNVRATEYTVGANGPLAMPAPLPPTSGYTYAVELSVDEAVAAGAKEVVFNQPVIQYVENFLSFPVGGIVPAGYYDRQKAAWIPSDNGKVIKILGTTGGFAEIDADGDGGPDTAEQLVAVGITDTERAQLASLYAANTSLWRVLVKHFTPWDYNWPYGPPEDAKEPEQPEPEKEDDPEDNPCKQSASIIECQNQVLGESVSIVGTPFSLNYRSYRVSGRKAASSLIINLSGPIVPASLVRIDLIINIGGREFAQSFPAAPNQKHVFTWDGLDAYGRPMNGKQTAWIRIGYVYPAVYQTPTDFERSFSLASGIPTANRARQEITLWQNQHGKVEAGFADEHSRSMGAWKISVHHQYDPQGRILHLGTGARRDDTGDQSATIMASAGRFRNRGFSGDGGPAVRALLNIPWDVVAAPNGDLYIADTFNFRIRRVSPDGIITTYAGTGADRFEGDNGPAIQANLRSPFDVAIGPDDSIYVAQEGAGRVRRITPDGIISTFAGTGLFGFSGDGGPATQATFSFPRNVAVSPDGSVYINDVGNRRIRRVSPDGIVVTVAGNGVRGFSGDGGPATAASFDSAAGLAVGPDGSLYITDLVDNRIRRVSPNGIMTTVAGNGTRGFNGDGGPATQASLNSPRDVAVAPDGTLYIADTGNHRIRRVSPSGLITTIAGGGGIFSGDNASPATQAPLTSPGGVAISADGSLYIADTGNDRVRRVSSSYPQFSAHEIVIASEDGRHVYIFSAEGRHLRTLNSLTSAIVYEFGYNPEGLLTTLTDGDGNVTSVERDANGNPTAIVSPDGLRTTLLLDPNGYLARIANPAGETFSMEYTAEGLLTAFANPRGATSVFSYDELGRLSKDQNAAGGFLSLSRTKLTNGYEVNERSALDRTRTYRVERLSTGDRQWINTGTDGTRTQTLFKTDGTTTTTTADGTTTTIIEGPDPRFGMQAPIERSVTTSTPSGLALQSTAARTFGLSDPNNLLSLTSQTDTVTVNGKITRNAYNAAARQHTLTTPTGRQTRTTTDLQGRITEKLITGVAPIQYAYDGRGRLTALSQVSGAEQRTAQLSYNAKGFVETLTDELGRVQAFTYDAAGRVNTQTLPDGRVITWSYDANGNIIGITPPGRPQHAFTYTPVDLEEEYRPPLLPAIPEPATRYAYNLDKQLTSITRPDGQIVQLNYDLAGRLSTVTLPGRIVTHDYSAATGQVTAINTDQGASLGYTYDGFLPVTESWSGPAVGGVTRAYNNDFLVTGLAVNGDSVPFAYDNDNLLTQAGVLSISRDAQNGFITGTMVGATTTSQAYNAFGEVNAFTAAQAGIAVLDIRYTRDSLGRITEKAEIIEGKTDTYAYTYDTAGRLTEVRKNGALEASYTYDANSNRLSKTSSAGTLSGTYDDQDRLLTYGANSYAYTANGELRTKTSGAQTTTYTYDALGNLTHVSLPDSTAIEYVIDGRNRRIGKKINGTLVQGFLYQDQLNPIAELDGTGAVVARFVYGTKIDVPDYMIKGGTTYRIISDHLGSPRLVINTTSSQIEQRLDYDEFGNVILDTNPGFQPFGFGGGLYDRDTGLVRFGARDYDSEAGRWTNKDPVLFGGGDANLYAYVAADPVNFVDPAGLATGYEVAAKMTHLLHSPATVAARFSPVAASFSVGFGLGSLANYACGGNCLGDLGTRIYERLHPEPKWFPPTSFPEEPAEEPWCK